MLGDEAGKWNFAEEPLCQRAVTRVLCFVAPGMSLPALLGLIQVSKPPSASLEMLNGRWRSRLWCCSCLLLLKTSLSLFLPIFLRGYDEAPTLQGCLPTECGCQGARCQQKDAFLCHKIIQMSWKPCARLLAVVSAFPSEPCHSLVLVCDCISLVPHLTENCSCLRFQVFGFFPGNVYR